MREGRGLDSVDSDRWSQALSWHEMLRNADEKELANSVGRDWQHWYADAKNRRIFDSISRLLAGRDEYRKRRRRRRAELQNDSYDLSVPIAEWRSKQGASCGSWLWWLFGGITVAAIGVLIILWPRSYGYAGNASRVVYQTKVGRLKDVTLPDGSNIILGGRTELSVIFSRQRRAIRVLDGQAWFKVTHDPHRPFIVTAGDGTITDIGTEFLVTRDSDRVVVTVTEGTVEVYAPPPIRPKLKRGGRRDPIIGLAPVRVGRGEQLAFTDAGTLGPLKQTDPHAATAWINGRLVFDNQPLRYVIDTVNRYSSRRIIISSSAGALRFSGVIFDNGIADWLQSLKAVFPLTVEDRQADVLIQMRSSLPQINDLQPGKQPRARP